MNTKNMGIILIVTGILIAGAGVYMVYTKPEEAVAKPAVKKQEVVAEKASKPIANSNKAKGDAFENYIVSLFDTTSGRFRLMEWRSDKMADNGMYAQSNKHPDLQFEFKGDKRTYKFAIECKWRSTFNKNGVEWATRTQIQNYLDYERKTRTKVFVAIGVGGSPENPERMFIAPLEAVSIYSNLFESYLKQFERKPTHNFFYSQHDQMLH